MPVEIFELVVKATVTDDTNSSNSSPQNSNQNSQQEQLSSLAVADQILETLKRKKER